MLKNESWDDTSIQEDINISSNPFLNTFYISFELCFPMQHVTTKLKNNCWLTKGIRISCKWKKSLTVLSSNRNYSIIKGHIDCCIILRKIIRNAKQTHYNHLLISAGYKSKATWNIINSESGNANNNKIRLDFIYVQLIHTALGDLPTGYRTCRDNTCKANKSSIILHSPYNM